MGPPPEDWRPPEPTDDAVQCTHVDAALAKLSCAQLGYFEDPYTEQLIRNNRPPSRSPLIHRGYYSRVAGIRRSVLSFLESCPRGGGVQIVNLGAGLDTTYFWLRQDPSRWREDLTYFEVDFPEVLSKKISALIKKPKLWPMVDAATQEELVASQLSASGTREIRTKHFRTVSTDMRIMPELTSSMTGAGFRGDVPTLFVSECVLVYMQAMHGDGIISWASSSVPNAPSAMLVYEQTNPGDPFGKVMVDNLMRRGCPLLSIFEYPSLAATRDRYLQRGFDRCALLDMNEVYSKYLDQADVERCHKLELMDEFEEWRLIQAHYFLLAAARAPGGDEDHWVHAVVKGFEGPWPADARSAAPGSPGLASGGAGPREGTVGVNPAAAAVK